VTGDSRVYDIDGPCGPAGRPAWNRTENSIPDGTQIVTPRFELVPISMETVSVREPRFRRHLSLADQLSPQTRAGTVVGSLEGDEDGSFSRWENIVKIAIRISQLVL
jgi:hypothetical protein